MIPNTTPTPNELYNGEMRKMTDTELRIVLVVTRATLGWEIDKDTKMRKKEDWISYRQLMDKTGRASRAIAQAIDGCVKAGWIEIRDKNSNILDTKNKRIGNKMYFRLGRIFIDSINPTPAERKEVDQTVAKRKIDQRKAYKRNSLQKDTNIPRKKKYEKYQIDALWVEATKTFGKTWTSGNMSFLMKLVSESDVDNVKCQLGRARESKTKIDQPNAWLRTMIKK